MSDLIAVAAWLLVGAGWLVLRYREESERIDLMYAVLLPAHEFKEAPPEATGRRQPTT